MIGIHFTAHHSPAVMLGALFGYPGLTDYSWNISEYIPMQGSAMLEGVYTASEAAKCAAAIPADEAAEYYCVFGVRKLNGGTGSVPQTFADYMDGVFEIAFVCTDSLLFDFYCKDEGVLRGIRRAFIDSGICADCDIEEYTMENNGRIGFYW